MECNFNFNKKNKNLKNNLISKKKKSLYRKKSQNIVKQNTNMLFLENPKQKQKY